MLGYLNAYGRYTDRPLLEPAQPGAAALPVAEDVPSRRDLGRNGSYLVLRELVQDVRGFWRFVAAQASDDSARIALAEAMVGRRMTGDPVLHEAMRQNGLRYVDATYRWPVIMARYGAFLEEFVSRRG